MVNLSLWLTPRSRLGKSDTAVSTSRSGLASSLASTTEASALVRLLTTSVWKKLPQACCYCGSSIRLSVDHLFPRMRGGADTGDNIVWACRVCNGSKGGRDMLEWL